MKNDRLMDKLPAWAYPVLCVILAIGVLVITHHGVVQGLSLGAGALMILVFATGDLKRLRNWPSIFLLGYAGFSMLTLFWAIAGKFFLTQYPKIFACTAVFLALVLFGRPDRSYARAVMGALAGASAVYAALELLGAALPVVRDLANSILVGGASMSYQSRLSGVVSNANVEAAIHVMGVFFSIALLCDSKERRERVLWAISLFLSATALLLGISLGALFFFALSIPVYLIFAGKGRSAALVRMLEGAALAVVFSILMIHFYGAGQGGIAFVLLLAGCAVAAALELKTAERVTAAFVKKEKLTFGALIAVVALAVVYLIAAMNISGPYTFGGAITRGADLASGEHVLSVEADGDVSVRVTYYTEERLMANSPDVAYEGSADGARFTLPKDVASVYLVFDAGEGVTLSKATVDDGTTVILRYAIMPSFLANRLGGAGNSQDVIQRFVYYRDSLRLIKLSPIMGHGVGSLETALTSVQDYSYNVRYVHNHYLQILIEDGVIGLALFMAALVSMGAALWKKRRQAEDGEFFWLYPALCAEFVMVLLHMLWDVFMSLLVSALMVYAFYGLIVALYAEPIPVREKVSEALKKKQKAQATSDSTGMIRVALIVLPVLYMLSICGNIYAQHELYSPHSSKEAAYAAMERIVKLDLYEKNDIMLSYLVELMNNDEEMSGHASKANEFADALSKVHSNAIPAYLVAYYFNTEQYERAIDEAMLGASYSLSDVNQWNTIADYLKQGFIDSMAASPLLEENGDALLDGLLEYKAVLDNYNAQSQNPLVLDGNAQEFFDKVARLDAVRGDYWAMVGIMME